MKPKRSAFTLVEILVVLAIIGILSALLFPVFNRAREGGRQAHCASNLKQIYLATRMYFDDERRYPASLIDLLPDRTKILTTATGAGFVFTNGSTGYLKGGMDTLHCLNDDSEFPTPRSSYGNLASVFDLPGPKNGLTGAYEENSGVDPARYVWNYWGYDPNGWAFLTADEAGANCTPSTANCEQARVPGTPYFPQKNPYRFSLSNRFAPPQTIITHCIYHRTSTSNARYPGDVGVPDGSISGGARGARDVVLRLDGSTKVQDVTTFNSDHNEWQAPVF